MAAAALFSGPRRAAALSFAVLVTGCLAVGWGVPAPTRAAAASDSMTVAEPLLPDVLNPYLARGAGAADVTGAIFEGLITITPHGSPRPRLALRWGRTRDSMRWTFWLNPAARWQDGVPVTARDVLFTARLVAAPAFGAASTLGFDHIRSITAVGDHVVTVVLTQPYAPFMATFATAPILPAHVLESLSPSAVAAYSFFNRRPIGSGPFAVEDVIPGEQVTLMANPLYSGKAPRVGRLVFRVFADRARAIAAARSGGYLVLSPALGLSAAEFLALRSLGTRAGIATYATPGTSWLHVDLVESGFLREGAVRRALAAATPKEEIVRQVLLGLGTVAGGDQAPWTRWYEPAVSQSPPFSPRAARQALLELGFRADATGRLERGGDPLAVTLWAPATLSGAVRTVDLIATAWRSIGVGVTVRVAPAARIFSPTGPLLLPGRFRSPTMNAVLYTWTNSPDPDDSAYWQSGQIAAPDRPAAGNFVGYRDAVADRLTARGQVAIDLYERTRIYQQLQLHLAHDQPAIFLAWPEVLSVAPWQLHGYQPNPLLSTITWNVADWQVKTAGR